MPTNRKPFPDHYAIRGRTISVEEELGEVFARLIGGLDAGKLTPKAALRPPEGQPSPGSDPAPNGNTHPARGAYRRRR